MFNKKTFLIFTLFFAGFFFFNISSASAATKYFCGASNTGNWNGTTSTHWFSNVGCTTSTSKAGVLDDVIITKNVTSNNGAAASVKTITVNGTVTIGIPITVSTSATFNDTSSVVFNGGITGSAIFNNESYIGQTTVTGNVTFNGASYVRSNGIVSGNAIFNGTSKNSGTITGNATFNENSRHEGQSIGGVITFNDSSTNLSLITGNPTFNGSSYNQNRITGNPIFNGSSHNDSSSGIIGNVTFNDTSYNNGTVNGNVIFNYASGGIINILTGQTWGTITGTIKGLDNVDITSWIFNGNSFLNGGSITGNATFNDTSYNSGTIVGVAKYNYATGGVITIADGGNWGGGTATSNVGIDDLPLDSWIFNGWSINSGTITGNAIFNNTSVNTDTGTVNLDATFNDLSVNGGVVVGTAIYNYAHTGIITIADGGNWSSGTATSIVGIDGNPITSWIFNGSSVNQGNIIGNVVFNNTSYNSLDKIITGNVTFNDTSKNDGTIIGTATYSYATGGVITILDGVAWGSGTATSNVGIDGNPITSWVFNGYSYNLGTITGDTVFNNGSGNEGTINGNSIFRDATYNVGNLNQNAIFLDTSFNYGTISGDACFSLLDNNQGAVSGVASLCTTPTLTTTDPTLVTEGDPEFTLTTTGTDFLFDSTINWNDTPLTTTYVSGTELRATVPSSNVLVAGTANITVNSPTLALTSTPQIFTINSIPVVSRSSSSGSMSTKAKALKNTIIPPTIPKTTPPVLTYNFGTTTLRKGSTGEAVKELQRFLNTKLNLGLVIDGILGPKTIAVIKKWQKDNGLVPDGLVGPKTKGKMNTN